MSKSQKKRLGRRALLLGGVQLGVAGLLGWRMHQLGVVQGDQFRLLAEENRINIRLDPPARGLIYDRNGNTVAQNRQAYTIEMVREQANDPEAVLRRLAQLVPLSEDQILDALAEMERRQAFVPVTVTTGLEWEHIAAVSANAPSLPGVTPRLGLYRNYPVGSDFAHIVGYVGPVSDYDLSQREDKDPLLLIPRFQIGKNGIESKADKTLRGKAGLKRIEVNSVGRVMRELKGEASTTGGDLQLTIEPEVQRYALERMEGVSAATVVLDVNNGDVMAMASAPTFDPNKFVDGISSTDWNELLNNEYRPLANKAVQGLYSPASTFKMVVALTALGLGVVNDREEVNCPGYKIINGRRFHCWRRGGHGNVNMREALRYSCDVYFYEMALRVGIDEISKTGQKFGLGIKPDLPLPAIRKGLMPTKAWKLAKRKQQWFDGDTANAGIGQGDVLTSPLQLATMTARLATGLQIEPRLLNMLDNKLSPIKEARSMGLNPQFLSLVQAGMYDVSNHPRGTAYSSRLQTDDKIAGKTGTSQVRAITKAERDSGVIKNKDLPWNRRDHALFVAYAPFDKPRYAISVIVEHGGGGSTVAAPIARDVMTKALSLGQSNYGPLPNQKRSQSQTPKRTRT